MSSAARVILRGKEDSRTTPRPQGEVLAEPAGGQARKYSTLQILRANRTSGTKASRRLPTQVVNDKGRYQKAIELTVGRAPAKDLAITNLHEALSAGKSPKGSRSSH